MHGWVISKRPDDVVNNIKDSRIRQDKHCYKIVALVRKCFIKYPKIWIQQQNNIQMAYYYLFWCKCPRFKYHFLKITFISLAIIEYANNIVLSTNLTNVYKLTNYIWFDLCFLGDWCGGTSRDAIVGILLICVSIVYRSNQKEKIFR